MSHLQVDSVLCHASLTVDLTPGCTLVTGKNTAGKTSLARIIAALAAHDPNPAGVNATQGGVYVLDGVLEGQARLDEVVWRPPAGISAPPRQVPRACPHAVGLIDFIRSGRTPKERSERWEGLFLPSDTMAILEPWWEHDVRQLHSVVKIVDEHGWEKALSIYEQKRVEAKRRWQNLTGMTRHGKKNALSWVPKGWRTELESSNEDELRAAAVDLKDQINVMAVQNAVDQHEIDKAQEVLSGALPQVQKEHADADDKYRETSQSYTALLNDFKEWQNRGREAEANIAELDRLLKAEAPYRCPGCDTGLRINNSFLESWIPPSPSDILKSNEDLTAQKDRRDWLSAQIKATAPTLEELRGKANQAMRERQNAEGRIVELKKQTEFADMTASSSNEQMRGMVEEKLREANDNLMSFRQWRDARRENDNIIELEAVCQLLGPTGARAEHMRVKMDKVRKIMANCQEVTGWEVITILEDYGLCSNTRQIALAAQNEQLKAQWLCQIAAAMLTNMTEPKDQDDDTPVRPCEFLVLDQGDALKDESWDGCVVLMNRLAAARPHLHIIVCATSTACPDGWAHVRLN